MAFSFFEHIPKKKVGIFLGFLTSAWVSKIAVTALAGLLATYLGMSFLTFWYISLPLKLLSMVLGGALCVQGLKHFSIWPMENVVSLFSLSAIEVQKFTLVPAIMWRDLKGALREFDRELLKFIGEVWFNNKFSEQNKALKETATQTNYHWWDIPSMLKQKAAAGLLHFKKEAIVPNAARAGVCELVHELSYFYQHGSQMPSSDSSEYKNEVAGECVNYQGSMFMMNLHNTGKGFFESIAYAAYNEYEHPPVRFKSR